eukprot:SAG31_NODE_43537_length_266_cov_1.407186_1_plen_22_part_01
MVKEVVGSAARYSRMPVGTSAQ